MAERRRWRWIACRPRHRDELPAEGLPRPFSKQYAHRQYRRCRAHGATPPQCRASDAYRRVLPPAEAARERRKFRHQHLRPAARVAAIWPALYRAGLSRYPGMKPMICERNGHQTASSGLRGPTHRPEWRCRLDGWLPNTLATPDLPVLAAARRSASPLTR